MNLKHITNLPSFASLMTLLFICSFCGILCLLIEDGFNCNVGSWISKFYAFDGYWGGVVAMFFTGGVASYLIRSKNRSASKLAGVMFALFILLMLYELIYIVGGYFELGNERIWNWAERNFATGNRIWLDLCVVGVDVLAVFLYLLVDYLFVKETDRNKKHFEVTSGVFLGLFLLGIGIAEHYMPISIIRTIRQDIATEQCVTSWANLVLGKLDSYEKSKLSNLGIDAETLVKEGMSTEHAQLKNENDKIIVTWEFLTDFEGLRKSGKLTKRMEKNLNGSKIINKDGSVFIQKIRDKDKKVVATYQYKKGSQKIELPYKKK